MVQKFLLQQVNSCNAEHPPPSLPFVDGTIITHLSGFVNVYHPPFSSGHPIFQCPAGKNPKATPRNAIKEVFNQLHKSYYHRFTAIKFAKSS